MFDVSWNDPTRETVGQRRTRRDREPSTSRASSVRSSTSSGSSTQKPSSLFGLFGNKRGNGPRAPSRTKAALGGDDIKKSRRISSYTNTSGDSSPSETPGPTKSRKPEGSFFSGPPYEKDRKGSQSDGSVFSGWTGRSTATESSWGSIIEGSKAPIVQPLSPKSFVTQSTEVTVQSSEHVDPLEHNATVIHISSAGTMPIKINDSESSSNEDKETTTFEFPIPGIQALGASSPIAQKVPAIQPAGLSVKARRRQSDSWRPPETWDLPSEESLHKKPARKYPIRKRITPTTEMTHLHKNIRKMEAASAQIVLDRLREEWLEVADASVYKDLEMEKQLWMLSALRNLQKENMSPDSVPAPAERTGLRPVQKLLSLYENHACSSFLSALSPSSRAQIHHLSPKPLSPKKFPNIHPLSVPSPSASLPYASRNFVSIHAFSIPSLLPSASLPALLKECHRCLVSASSASTPGPFATPAPPSSPHQAVGTKAGILHLTIIDPSPIAETLGPRLRAWLDEHLLINLERSFRCVNPGRLFPIWLSDARLRGQGSTIKYIRFWAAGKGERQDEREQLQSVVGRMLWKEMWGGHVRTEGEGQSWWWDDEDIIEECSVFGTRWEYAAIEAAKEG